VAKEIDILTLDGPGGAGKGTVALQVAETLHWHYLDSGAIYRVLGLLAQRQDIPLDSDVKLAELARNMNLVFEHGEVIVSGEKVDHLIRSESAGDRASRLAAQPMVRKALLDWQRGYAQVPGLVADGRDMGTVVFPWARCKIFLTASAEARAKRRFNQLRLKGFDVNIRQLFEEITERDQRDANRPVSPLKPAEDAFILDTTEMTVGQVVAEVLKRVDTAITRR